MTTDTLHDPIVVDEPIVDRNGVRRSKDGRPYIAVPCPAAVGTDRATLCVDGRVPGKREGTTKQCPKCKGEGMREVLMTRCTTFVGALEDRNGLENWMKRTVLVGMSADHHAPGRWGQSLVDRVREVDPDDRETLDALADEAFTLGEGYEKAQKGTDLHELMEKVDRGEPLPDDVTLDDRRDVAAWLRLLDEYGLTALDIERFVVNDELRVAGTYDRRMVSTDPRLVCQECNYSDEAGWPTKPKVVDLKTGRVDYGGGKMRQQLAMYAYSDNYEPTTGERTEQDVCRHVGFIVHLPAGSGTASLLRCDLVAGWRDVHLSAAVREHRRVTKSCLELVDDPLELSLEVPLTTPQK